MKFVCVVAIAVVCCLSLVAGSGDPSSTKYYIRVKHQTPQGWYKSNWDKRTFYFKDDKTLVRVNGKTEKVYFRSDSPKTAVTDGDGCEKIIKDVLAIKEEGNEMQDLTIKAAKKKNDKVFNDFIKALRKWVDKSLFVPKVKAPIRMGSQEFSTDDWWKTAQKLTAGDSDSSGDLFKEIPNHALEELRLARSKKCAEEKQQFGVCKKKPSVSHTKNSCQGGCCEWTVDKVVGTCKKQKWVHHYEGDCKGPDHDPKSWVRVSSRRRLPSVYLGDCSICQDHLKTGHDLSGCKGKWTPYRRTNRRRLTSRLLRELARFS